VDTDGSPARRGMMSHMAPRDIELSEWAKSVPVLIDGRWERVEVPIWTVRGWARMHHDFPEETRSAGNTRLWPPAVLDKWKRQHPTLGLGRGGHNRKG
jgi:hypothetical protein